VVVSAIVISSSWRILARRRAHVQPRERRDGDAGEDREPAERLRGPERVAERDHARDRPDERLEVDERPRELRGHADLSPREQPERRQRAGQSQPEHGGDRSGRRGGRRRTLGEHGDGQRRERGGAELHRRHRGRVAAGEQARLDDDQARRAGDRHEHEQIAGERRAGAAAAGHEPDARDRDQRAGPGGRAARRAPDRRGDDRHEHGHGADEERGVADARALDAGVLEQDHGAVAERSRAGHRRRERAAQAAPREQREDRRGDAEPRHREPARAEPFQADLGQRHGQPPQRARRRERDDCGCPMRQLHAHIVGPIGEISSWI
jgi:hypothetical protein